MTLTRDPLDDRIRHTLRTVAGTVTPSDPAPARVRTRPRRRRWPYALGAIVVGVPLTAAATAGLRTGPEYVDTIPPSSIVLEGDIDGDDYLVVESRRTDSCDRPVTGVEILRKSQNLLGSEWNTVGSEYGGYGADGCIDPGGWLTDPSRSSDGGLEVGDSYLWHWAVHPDVTAVRVSFDGEVVDLGPVAVDGAGYAVWEVPEGVRHWTTELVVGDRVVPGSADEQTVRDH